MKVYHHKVLVHWGDTDPAKIVPGGARGHTPLHIPHEWRTHE